MSDKKDNSMKKAKKDQVTKKKFSLCSRFLFCGILVIFGVIGLMFFLRPDTSEVEKRELTSFPKLTMGSLMSGRFTEEVGVWFADTFPTREHSAEKQAEIVAMRGVGDPAPSGYCALKETIPEIRQGVADAIIAEENELLEDPYTPAVALTFDDGPNPENTTTILDALEKYNAHATFFVVGTNVEEYPEIVQREVSLGCEVGNHSYDHTSFKTLDAEGIKTQISKTDTLVDEATGVPIQVVRIPGGAYDETIQGAVDKPIILWDIDTLDWKTRDANSTVKTVMSQVEDGDIILMHDLYEASAEAAVTLIQKLSEAGYKLLTISELAQLKGVTLVNGEYVTDLKYHPEDHIGDKYERSAGVTYQAPAYITGANATGSTSSTTSGTDTNTSSDSSEDDEYDDEDYDSEDYDDEDYDYDEDEYYDDE